MFTLNGFNATTCFTIFSLKAEPLVVTPHLMPFSWQARQMSRKPFLMNGSPPENSTC